MRLNLPNWLVVAIQTFRGRCTRVLNGRGCELEPGHGKRCVTRVGRRGWRVEF